MPTPTKARRAPALRGIDKMPVSSVEWVERDSLHANDYNPNTMFSIERALLRVSLLEDGWTQPIVARVDGEIVDGFHRWLTSADPDVYAMTDGLVPVVRIKHTDPAQQRMATIRHNRARGEHGVVPMADIVADLVDMGVTSDEMQARLGMEGEEVDRLLDRGRMTDRAGRGDFNKGWTPGEDRSAPPTR